MIHIDIAFSTCSFIGVIIIHLIKSNGSQALILDRCNRNYVVNSDFSHVRCSIDFINDTNLTNMCCVHLKHPSDCRRNTV
jgi:hypothetical protein